MLTVSVQLCTFLIVLIPMKKEWLPREFNGRVHDTVTLVKYKLKP